MTIVRFLSPAEKYLRKLKDKTLKQLFQDAVDVIAADPEIGEEKTGDLAGIRTYGFRYAKTDYRLAYRIEYVDDTIVIVVLAGTHEGFYEQIKRYLR